MNEKQAAGRSRKSELKDKLRKRLQSSSHQTSRAPSPIPSGGAAENINDSATAGASSSISVGLADGSQDQNTNLEMETGVARADPAQDMWTIAETQLRLDEKKNKLLDAYSDILNSKLDNVDCSSTPDKQKQKQISAFIDSEARSFHDAGKLGTFANVLKKAADCILKAEKVISAATQPCLPASIACAGVMLVLSVSSPLLLCALMLIPR